MLYSSCTYHIYFGTGYFVFAIHNQLILNSSKRESAGFLNIFISYLSRPSLEACSYLWPIQSPHKRASRNIHLYAWSSARRPACTRCTAVVAYDAHMTRDVREACYLRAGRPAWRPGRRLGRLACSATPAMTPIAAAVTPIAADARRLPAIRPPRAGRTGVVEVGSGGEGGSGR